MELNPEHVVCESGLKRLSDGRWCIRYRDPVGNDRRKIVDASKTRALQELSRLQTWVKEGRYYDQPEVKAREGKAALFETVVEEFVLRSRDHLSPNSARQDEQVGRQWCAFPRFARKPLVGISVADVEAYKVERAMDKSRSGGKLRTQRVKQGTVNLELSRLKTFFNFAVERGYCQTNPAERVKPYRVDNSRIRYLSDSEEQDLLRAAMAANRTAVEAGLSPRSPQRLLLPFIVVALHTGMREGELKALKWAQIDFENQSIEVPSTVAKMRRTRIVYLDEATLAILHALPRPAKSDEPLFGGLRANLDRYWRPVLHTSGLANFHFHDLRHTYASRLVRANTDLYKVMQLLGHRSIKVTQRYAHLAAIDLKAAVATVSKGWHFPGILENAGDGP